MINKTHGFIDPEKLSCDFVFLVKEYLLLLFFVLIVYFRYNKYTSWNYFDLKKKEGIFVIISLKNK